MRDRAGRVLEPYLLAALGGSAGALLRYLTFQTFPSPYSTLYLNTVSCFFLGFIMYEEMYIGALSAQSRVLLSAGFLGSLSTFSAFVSDAFSLPTVYSIAYVLSTLALGMLAVYSGRAAALYLAGRGGG
ncbi:MAG: chromosome condensation protein CrcB [Euryarchaeota archaeon]|nr:chromosome condensation protein CrcB [Euryarchaeota archaeon]